MHSGSDGRRFAVHDHRPGATPGGSPPEPLALEVRRTADEASGALGARAASGARPLRIEPHACVAAFSDDDAADLFLARLLRGDRPGRSVSVYGVDVRADRAAVQRLVGVVSVGMPLPEVPVRDALMTAGRHKGLSAETASQRTADLTDVLGLRAVEHAAVSGLSPGQRSRVALGCALLHVPKLLLLCQPLDDVDSASEKIICRVLGRYTASTGTAVFSTRSRSTAHRVAGRVFSVHDDEVCFTCPSAPH
ncbi:hypothetical protein [Streptomyces lasiicapitis]|uniref:ATP-binding cassette domain-containing protein n=1 Tax=Streptomyces lasiicapitis TaxID=1923961 RepID=A0ABQ2LK39_9ACTN|nr:hypothetical protein [Streptomyces lasiicapitis]GGO37782.1 hypothetical protein GCM10012286_11780 [Streptomyces lasiicapitis]